MATTIAQELLLVQQWTPTTDYRVGLNGVTWTLSVEFFFYLLFPFLMRWASRQSTRPLVVLTTLAWLATGVWSLVLPRVAGHPKLWWTELNPYVNLPQFMIGMTIALVLKRSTTHTAGLARSLKVAGFVTLLATLACYVAVGEELIGGGFIPSRPFVVCVPFALLIAGYAASEVRGGGLCPAWLVILGEWSVALYLVHRDVVFAHLWPHLDGRLPRPLAAVILTAAAIAASGVLYMLVERPAERWLRARGPEEAVTA